MTGINLMYQCTFMVVGGGSFPLDMLRYDRCWPKTQADASIAEDKGQRLVTMATYRETGQLVATAERWRSFNWVVVEVTDQKGKMVRVEP